MRIVSLRGTAHLCPVPNLKPPDEAMKKSIVLLLAALISGSFFIYQYLYIFWQG